MDEWRSTIAGALTDDDLGAMVRLRFSRHRPRSSSVVELTGTLRAMRPVVLLYDSAYRDGLELLVNTPGGTVTVPLTQMIELRPA